MKKTNTLTSLLILLACHIGFAQTKEVDSTKFQHEFGLNVTNLLTDLLGNNNRTDPGIYLLSYKKLKGNRAFRLGATINYSLRNTNNVGFNAALTDQNFQLRIGRETRKDIAKRFQYYYGLDAIGGYQQQQSVATINGGQIIQTDRILTLGGGPVLGFQFALYSRLLIGTEGSLYAAYNNSSVDFESSGLPGGTFPSKKSNGLNIQTNLPKFLFLIVKF